MISIRSWGRAKLALATLSTVSLVASIVLLTGCATPSAPQVSPAAVSCAALVGPIAPTMIGLPTNGAVVESAVLMPPSDLRVTLDGPIRPAPADVAVAPALPEYCKVLGYIAPIDPNAPPVRFEVNLPTRWNGRSVQFGGGGFNGVLINALGLPPDGRPDLPGPLARGFATYGTDSGHQNNPSVPLQAFALNQEALENFAFASYKKVKDVAVVLMRRNYGRPPERLYFMGSSEGGREGVTMAQRFPNDFDGIFSRVPVLNWVGLQFAGTRTGILQHGPGWLSPADVATVSRAVLATCDAQDGIVDGVVSDYAACSRTFDPRTLGCAAGVTGGCLNSQQVLTVMTLHAPFNFPYPLQNGVQSYPGWEYGGEAATGTGPVGGYVSWQTGSAPSVSPPSAASSRAWLYGAGAMQYFIAQDAAANPDFIDPVRYRDRVLAVSALMDSTDPDLSAFAAHGGKLIISEHLADYAQSPYAGINYYNAILAKMGAQQGDAFVRLYVTPGADHMGAGVPSSVDMLGILSGWVEEHRAPQDLVQVREEMSPPFPVVASRPMCQYPDHPQYTGKGDPQSSTSYRCQK